eukprot:TRINITY_DN42048_c0_g1_i1.p1 TRINITY_DN42048_c0_g1~~TRINITY_DN42048_c0_g1_i1.p1  ORF type:complete len:509 (-),score=91.92 TRINITY_DN42048_c0_g1_i1:133-1659(-)
MEALAEYAAAAKAYAFPVAGIVLVLYPVGLVAWCAIEGRMAAKEQERHAAKSSSAEKPSMSAASKSVAATEDKKKPGASGQQRTLTIAALAAMLLAFAGRFTSSCFTVVMSPLNHWAGSASTSLSSAQAPDSALLASTGMASTSSIALAASGAALACGVALFRQASLAKRQFESSWPLARRGSGQTARRAAFMVLPETGLGFDRQLSGPWTAAESPASPLAKVDCESDKPPSLWHDVSLYVTSWLDEPTGLLRYVNEMPMGTLRKWEVQPGVPYNIIEEDVKGSKKLAKFGKPVPFNYGCFPQTYRDPKKPDKLYGAPGDDDPLDVIDLNDQPTEVGTVVNCRPLGAVCLIDEGQADWKVLVVNVDVKNPLASARSVEDVERIAPGRMQACWDWLDELKRAGGKGDATLHRKIHDTSCALELIAEDHDSWQELVWSAGADGTANGHWIKPSAKEEAPFARTRVLKLGWAPPCTVPGKILRSPGKLAGAAKVSVLSRAARAFSLAPRQQ